MTFRDLELFATFHEAAVDHCCAAAVADYPDLAAPDLADAFYRARDDGAAVAFGLMGMALEIHDRVTLEAAWQNWYGEDNADKESR